MFSQKLKLLRKKNGLTQEQLAKAIGVERSSVGKYEGKGNVMPSHDVLAALSSVFGVSIDYLLDNENQQQTGKGVKIPVLGKVIAGIPIEAVEEILDYEEISQKMDSQGEHFALQIQGNSMEPKFSEGDVVIVRKQSDVDSGDIAVVLIDGNEATIKKIKKSPDGVMLVPLNQNYEVMFYTNNEIEELPVIILGKVVELRAKF